MSKPLVSVIVPTYNERDNIPELVRRLDAALRGLPYEIVIVDDNSPDGTAEVALELSKQYPIRVVKRPGKLGLASAVLDGFKVARGDILVVMDADLQHSPEVVPKLVEKIREGYDVVIASRYVPGGKTVGWSLIRKIISKVAIALVHILLPETRRIRDPISGFFAVRRSVVENFTSRPLGFKILLDILVRGRYNSVVEVPYTFEPRRRGKSKLSRTEIFNYLKQLLELTEYRAVKFAVVGATGILVNTGLLHLLVTLGVPVYIASPVAIETAILNNFTWNNLWTFRNKRCRSEPLLRRLAKYHLSVAVGAVVNYLVVTLLVLLLGVHHVIANLIGITLGCLANYLVSELYVWS